MRKCITYTYNGSIPPKSSAVKHIIACTVVARNISELKALYRLDCEVQV